MSKRALLALTAASLLLPAQAQSQIAPKPNAQEYLQFVGGSGVNGNFGVQVGPYVGRFGTDPSSPLFSLYCVDFDHYARSTQVVVSQLTGDLSATRLGSTGGDASAYVKAAYLSTLFETHRGDSDAWSSLHAAIWTTIRGSLDPADPNFGNTVPNGPDAMRDQFLTQADQALADGWGADASWYVLTPDNGRDPSDPWHGQEFIIRADVPEPSTLLLLASGFLLLVGVHRRRLEVARLR